MSSRRISLLDRCISEMDHALRVVTRDPEQNVDMHADDSNEDKLRPQDKALSARLMRVNHSGEVSAQALYRGQALVANSTEQREHLLTAAEEENDHLAWCQKRTQDLGGRVSYLTPGWYLGSFAIGVAAGLAGDRTSLGFLAETESQVTEHLNEHLQRLPAADKTSRAILTQMREDEVRHGENATERGAAKLPNPVIRMMRGASKIMTTLSYRL